MIARILLFSLALSFNLFANTQTVESELDALDPTAARQTPQLSLAANYQSNFYQEDQVGSGQTAIFTAAFAHPLTESLSISHGLSYSKRLEDYREGDFDNYSLTLQGLNVKWTPSLVTSFVPTATATINEEQREVYYSQGSVRASAVTVKSWDLVNVYLNVGGAKNIQEFKTDFEGKSLTSYFVVAAAGVQYRMLDRLMVDLGYSMLQGFTYDNTRKDPTGSFSLLATYLATKKLSIVGGLTSQEKLYNDAGNSREWERYIVSSDTVLTLGMNYVF